MDVGQNAKADGREMLDQLLLPTEWYAKKKAGVPKGLKIEFTEVKYISEPSEVFSLEFLRKTYPGDYDENSTWEDFFEEGIKKGHHPSALFSDYLSIVEKIGILSEPSRSSPVWHVVENNSITSKAYINAIFSATNEIEDLEYFNVYDYYTFNPDVLNGEFPAHVHYILSGCYHGRKANRTELPEILSRLDSNPIIHELTRIQKELGQPVHPESPLEFIIAHTPIGVDWKKKLTNLVNQTISDADRISTAESSHGDDKNTVNTHENSQRFIDEIRASGEFNDQWHLQQNPDIERAKVDPIWHYVTNGEREGRWPNANFDPSFYLRVNSDVRKAGLNAFVHYLRSGRTEGRHPREPSECRLHLPGGETVLFIGHDAILAGAQRVLLDIVQWTYDHTNRKIAIILLGPGPLSQEFARLGKTLVVNDPDSDHNLIASFLKGERISFVYANTVVSGKFFIPKNVELIRRAPVVAHIHELEKVIRNFEKDFLRLRAQTKLWICASEPTRKHLVDRWNIPADSIKTIHAFITLKFYSSLSDARAIARDKLSVSANAQLVIGCGTVYERKGADIFVASAIEYFSKNKQSVVQFIWIGDGSDRRRLQQHISDAGLTDRIMFLGFRDDANELVAAADVFMLPSREDPFPLVCLEAAQYEVPTLCVRGKTGIVDFIEEDAGFIEDTLEYRVLADALDIILSNSEVRKARGRRAREKVNKLYTRDRALILIEKFLWRGVTSPCVSVVVPNFNHEEYLDDRLSSITSQTIKNIEVIVLDDCSTDRSLEVIGKYTADPRVVLDVNTVNSGGVFFQWEKGLSLSSAPLVWIAESDDRADLNFLSELLRPMTDESVVISFCKSEIIRSNGELVEGALDPYLSRNREISYSSDFRMPGGDFVRRGFAALCTIVNASSVVMRRFAVTGALSQAKSFRMCGDWLVYLHCLRFGDISFTTSSRSYFRRHERSAVHALEGSDVYFSERTSIAKFTAEHFRLPLAIQKLMIAEILHELERFEGRYTFEPVEFLDSLGRAVQRRTIDVRSHKIAFYVHGMLFSTGGIERLAAQLSNFFCQAGYDVTIYCAPAKGGPVYPLSAGVKVKAITITDDEGERIFAETLKSESYEVLIPMLSEHLFEHAIRAANMAEVKVIASEHNDPWVIEQSWWTREKRQEYFGRCTAIHLLLRNFENSLDLGNRARTFIIPNGVDTAKFACTEKRGREKQIIAVGRLCKQKRMDLLISGFALVREQFPEWSLHIFGEGELRFELMQQIQDGGLGDHVFLRGISGDLSLEYNQSSIFALSSDFEGFGIVVVEALACGLPVIAFSDCNGPNEIVRHGVDGILVSERSAMSLATGLQTLMAGGTKFEAMQAAAISRARDFELTSVLARWERMVESVIRI